MTRATRSPAKPHKRLVGLAPACVFMHPDPFEPAICWFRLKEVFTIAVWAVLIQTINHRSWWSIRDSPFHLYTDYTWSSLGYNRPEDLSAFMTYDGDSSSLHAKWNPINVVFGSSYQVCPSSNKHWQSPRQTQIWIKMQLKMVIGYALWCSRSTKYQRDRFYESASSEVYSVFIWPPGWLMKKLFLIYVRACFCTVLNLMRPCP